MTKYKRVEVDFSYPSRSHDLGSVRTWRQRCRFCHFFLSSGVNSNIGNCATHFKNFGDDIKSLCRCRQVRTAPYVRVVINNLGAKAPFAETFIWICYRTPKKLREGNLFIGVCLSVHGVRVRGRRFLWRSQPQPPPVQGFDSNPPLYRPLSLPPKHVKICSTWIPLPLPQDMLTCSLCSPHTSIGKRVVGIFLECSLVRSRKEIEDFILDWPHHCSHRYPLHDGPEVLKTVLSVRLE